jgi:hypothetical protein
MRAHDGLLWPQQAPALLDAVATALDEDRSGVQRSTPIRRRARSTAG